MASLSFVFLSHSVLLLSHIYSIYSIYVHMSVSDSIPVCCRWSVLSGWRMLLVCGKHLLQETVCVCVWTAYFRTFSLADFDAVLKRGLLAKKGSWVKFMVACAPWALICDPPVFVFCGSAILSSGWMDDTCPPRFVYMAAFFQARNMIECNYYKCGLTSEPRSRGQGAKAISWPPRVFGQRMILEDDICMHMCAGVRCDNICVHVKSQCVMNLNWLTCCFGLKSLSQWWCNWLCCYITCLQSNTVHLSLRLSRRASFQSVFEHLKLFSIFVTS